MDAVWIALLVIVFLIVLVIAGWPVLLRRFVKQYYVEKYAPETLQNERLEGYPAEIHLTDVPWITCELQTCQSTSLQMIAAHFGVDYPRPYHDFLMGFTYGASRMPGVGFSPFGSDPEVGIEVAAPYLGLARRYFISSEPSEYTAALRTFLSLGHPLRIALDMGTLYDHPKFIAHSVVLVGYDSNGFYYYETVARPPSQTEAGTRQPGERGIFVPDAVLLNAVERLSVELKHPWRYAVSVFEQSQTEEDLRPVWTRNGNALVEDNKYGPKMGARVIEELADEIVREGPKFNLDIIRDGMALAAEVRQDNADFLRNVFPYDADVQDAAEQLEIAAKDYRFVVDDIQDGITSQIEAKRVATRLREAAGAERKAGEIFRKRGLPEEQST